MKSLAFFALALILAGSLYAAESKYILNYKRLSSGEIGISCSNNADPTGQKIGQTLVISCGTK